MTMTQAPCTPAQQARAEVQAKLDSNLAQFAAFPRDTPVALDLLRQLRSDIKLAALCDVTPSVAAHVRILDQRLRRARHRRRSDRRTRENPR